MPTTIDPNEIEKFSKISEEWWDPLGKFKPLHVFNPVRLTHIRNEICAHFNRDCHSTTPLDGLRLLDIGCGGGLASEPMCRLGAKVVGLDAAERNVKTAQMHALGEGLAIEYRNGTAEELALSEAESFDIVLNLEVIEHVADISLFLAASAALLKPGGIMIVATINRTLRAFAAAKIGAEYILRWLPMGTHDPFKFVKPIQIETALTRAGMHCAPPIGVSYALFTGQWRLSQDISINYMMSATRPDMV